MSQKIVYHDDGTKTCYIDGNTVSEDVFFDRDCGSLGIMLAEQKPPRGVSDCTFMHDSANGKQFAGQEHIGDHYRSIAEEAGQNTTGKKYLSGLARFPGDPEAWIDSRGDVERLAAKRGFGVEGTINIKPRESIEAPKASCPDVADDILNYHTEVIASQHPDSHMIDKQDLKEQVRERLKPKNKPVKATKATKPY